MSRNDFEGRATKHPFFPVQSSPTREWRHCSRPELPSQPLGVTSADDRRPYQSLDALRARAVRAGAEVIFRFDLNFLSDTMPAEYFAAASIVMISFHEIVGGAALSYAINLTKSIAAISVGNFAERPSQDNIELVPPRA